MADNARTDQWRWKGSADQDRSRRDEINRHDGNQNNAVVYRKKTRDQRRRREKMKKRWSVRPDVNLTLVPRGKQCQIITAVIFIFFGLFLAVAGLVVLVILSNVSTVLWGVGIGMLVVGVVVLIAGLLYMLCKCCFRTSTRYKQYKAQFKSGGRYDMSEITAEQSQEMKSAPPLSTTQTHDTKQEIGGSHRGYVSEQPSDMTSRTYVTATEHTPSMPNASGRPVSTPQWITPSGYRPMQVSDLSDYTTGMQTAADNSFDQGVVNGQTGTHTIGASSSHRTEHPEDVLKNDFDRLEEALREMILNKSGGEMGLLSRGPLDTSTPVNPRGYTHQRVHGVPTIRVEGDHQGVHTVPVRVERDHQGVHTVPVRVEGDNQGVHTVPVMVEGGHHEVHTVPISVTGDHHEAHMVPIRVEGDRHGVHTVPINIEGDHHGVHTVPINVEGYHGVQRVPIVVEGDHRATPPNPIPPSYDQVLKNYRTYSRSASPTRLMESDL